MLCASKSWGPTQFHPHLGPTVWALLPTATGTSTWASSSHSGAQHRCPNREEEEEEKEEREKRRGTRLLQDPDHPPFLLRGGKKGWLIETELPKPPAEFAGDLIS